MDSPQIKLYSKAEVERLKNSKTVALSEQFIENIKNSAKKNGTFKVVASTNKENNNGWIMSQEGMDAERWKKNPIILYNHGGGLFTSDTGLPIGIGTNIYTEDFDGDRVESNNDTEKDDNSEQVRPNFNKSYTKRTVIEGIFAGNERAQGIRELYDLGLSSVSVGADPIQMGKQTDTGAIPVDKWELHELSFCNVPADEDCVAILNNNSVNMERMMKNNLLTFTGNPENMTIKSPAIKSPKVMQTGYLDMNVDNSVDNGDKAVTLEMIKDVVKSVVREEVAKNNTTLENSDEVKETQKFVNQQNLKRLQHIASLMNCVLRDVRLQK